MTSRHPSVAAVESLFENTRVELGDLIEHETIETLAEQAFFMRLEVRGDSESIAAARQKLEALVRELQHDSPDEVADAEVRRLLLGWYPLRR